MMETIAFIQAFLLSGTECASMAANAVFSLSVYARDCNLASWQVISIYKHLQSLS